MLLPEPPDLSFSTLRRRYRSGELLPSALMREICERIEAAARPEIWIGRVALPDLLAQAALLDAALHADAADVFEKFPLFGLPFAVKDNIDVAAMATTAACPAYAYVPAASAQVVERLQAAGAILIGKTNLDQFATGLVGTRSPYGAVRNAVDMDYVSGGSSSGSAVAVALRLVSFALGTDTAGSGRVPAGFNGIVGLKPSRGLVSMRGVVPACRSLDCVSVFAASVPDAWRVLQCAAAYDDADPYSRRVSMAGVRQRGYRIGVPDALEFFGDALAEAAFSKEIARIASLPNVEIVPIPFAPFAEAANLLYQGPWVAERRAAIGDLFDQQPEAMDPVVRDVVGNAARFNAVDAFRAQYRLADLRRSAERSMATIDMLVVPTAPTMPTIAAVAADPVRRNSELGYYTNFVNFFDQAALAIPASPRTDGLPAGITLIGACGTDHMLAAAAIAIGAAPGERKPAAPDDVRPLAADPLPFNEPTVSLAVVGAHLEGQPLAWQLLERGARKSASTATAAAYRLYALPDTTPPKPGLARVANGGMAIAVEVWELPLRHFGSFVADVPAPLGIGSVELADGRIVKGFICEPSALDGAQDISAHGGWRAYLASR
ncbi:allophanate hydrolase [Noviherbaspirillum suwonense]|uniref:Allophanate hydrolase n=1 Tax=Noviherbaspirillum suwonense TaxID=1224511 RepID=A0ABY1Q055_9BURK|nr:allophanate hydrolase [Noviherbaspirillum suwonense]SMP53472.1 allophanate hydrolase [Noviherbaspirillum suwonense]